MHSHCFLTRALTVFDSLQIEEENAALLAALTDSLDGMVDAEVGGLSVFPALGEEPDQEEEEEPSLPLSTEDFSQSLGAETEDPSLVRTRFSLFCYGDDIKRRSERSFPSSLGVPGLALQPVSEHLPPSKRLICSPHIPSCLFFVSVVLESKSGSQLRKRRLLKWSLSYMLQTPSSPLSHPRHAVPLRSHALPPSLSPHYLNLCRIC